MYITYKKKARTCLLYSEASPNAHGYDKKARTHLSAVFLIISNR